MDDTEKKLCILFLCTGNSCRSQLAEAWARKLKSSRIEAFSAGTDPKGIHPMAIEVMEEVGVDLAGHRSQHLNEFEGRTFDPVITLCGDAHEKCPVFPGNTEVLHVGFDDPAKATGTVEEILSVFRRIRDEIRDFVQGLEN